VLSISLSSFRRHRIKLLAFLILFVALCRHGTNLPALFYFYYSHLRRHGITSVDTEIISQPSFIFITHISAGMESHLPAFFYFYYLHLSVFFYYLNLSADMKQYPQPSFFILAAHMSADMESHLCRHKTHLPALFCFITHISVKMENISVLFILITHISADMESDTEASQQQQGSEDVPMPSPILTASPAAGTA